MTNGFYNIKHFKLKEVKEFTEEAVKLAYLVKGENKYKEKSSRKLDKTINLKYLLDKFESTIGDFNSKQKVEGCFAVINRHIYNRHQVNDDNPYEIVLYNSDWEFVYIFVNEYNFNYLINKYNLKLNEF